MSEELIYLNGINGATGDYLTPPLTEAELAQLALEQPGDDPTLQKELQDKQSGKSGKLGTIWSVDPTKLEEAGWGVIFASNADPQIREALSELLTWRKKQANAKKKLYREFTGKDGVAPNETKNEWLARQGAAPGPVDPVIVPYYLLIVGSPQEIPYIFQYQLDVAYAVGRIHFDTLDEYARYARSVVDAEKGKVKMPRHAAFFATQNPDDVATGLSSRLLVRPLVDKLTPALPNWKFTTSIGAGQATKARLLEAMGGASTPALLFTASHGMALPNTDKGQREHQGALVTQDYPGPRDWRKALPQDYYLAGDDIASDARLLGVIGFHFACYGAGTPNENEFPAEKSTAYMVPDKPFLARLPQRMLGHPNGGALAVIGHVERAWSYSFTWNQIKFQTAVFESAVGRILQGSPLGAAMEFFGDRHGELAVDLGAARDDVRVKHQKPDNPRLSFLWTANNDARSYVILGDPAVRLALSDAPEAEQARPTIEVSTVVVPQAAGETEPAAPPSIQVKTVVVPQTAPQAAAALPEGMAAATDFGNPIEDALTSLRKALEDFANNVGSILSRTVEDVTTLKVKTFVSDDMNGVQYQKDTFSNAQLRALTAMSLDGDTLVCVPRRTSDVDEELWNIHSATVMHAQAYRTELLKATVSAAAGLFNVLKQSG